MASLHPEAPSWARLIRPPIKCSLPPVPFSSAQSRKVFRGALSSVVFDCFRFCQNQHLAMMFRVLGHSRPFDINSHCSFFGSSSQRLESSLHATILDGPRSPPKRQRSHGIFPYYFGVCANNVMSQNPDPDFDRIFKLRVRILKSRTGID
jgi:hypothetical protein